MNIVKETANHIKKGKIVLYPTDTIWGLGCDLYNTNAVNKIIELKKRPANKGFILLLNNLADLEKYVLKVPSKLSSILNKYNKPTTIILNNPKNLPDYITVNNCAAFRLINNNFCKQVINTIQMPLISTSANISNEQSPNSSLDSVSETIKNNVDYIAIPKINTCTGKSSSIIHINEDNKIVLIRP